MEILLGSPSEKAAPLERREAGDAHARDLMALPVLLERLSDEGAQALDAALELALAEGARQDVEAALVLPSGEQRHALAKIRALRRNNGEVTGVIASVLDVTEAARAREEL